MNLTQTLRDKQIRKTIKDGVGDDNVLAELSQETIEIRRGLQWQWRW